MKKSSNCTKKNKKIKKIHGGFFNKVKNMFSKKNDDILTKKETDNDKTLKSEKTEEIKDSLNKIKAKQSEFQNKANDKIRQSVGTAVSVASTASSAFAVGNVAIGVVAATGIGLPVAGLLAGVMLVANKLMNQYIANLELKSVMYDVMNILTHCYNLNEMIEMVTDKIKNRMKDTQTPLFKTEKGEEQSIEKILVKIDKHVEETLRKHGLIKDASSGVQKGGTEEIKYYPSVDENIVSQVNDKLLSLLNLLLSIAPSDAVNLLDEISVSEKMKSVIGKEKDSRSKKFSNFFNSISRTAKRFLSPKRLKVQILEIVTLVNAYFMLMNSQFEETLRYYEMMSYTNEWVKLWEEIHKNDKYVAFVMNNPVKISELKEEAKNLDITKLEEKLEENKENEIDSSDSGDTEKVGGYKRHKKTKKMKNKKGKKTKTTKRKH
jgi:hypothetical protein